MRRAIRRCVAAFAETFRPDGPVVEIGSCFPSHMADLCDLRPLFSGREFIGCDIRPGPGVDRIDDAHDLSFADGFAGAVLMFEVLEHLPAPCQALEQVYRVLRDDGLLAISVPFNYRLHGFPTDYWRFTASGVDQILSPFPQRVVIAIGPRLKPAFIFAIAARASRRDFEKDRTAFLSAVTETMRQSRMRGHWSLFKERSRDLFGLLLGRAEPACAVFDPHAAGGYTRRPSPDAHAGIKPEESP